jgi:holo-[acyl-carrier protein] synthase
VTVLGVGLDIVDVAGFADQLADRASGFVAATFRPAERRDLPDDDVRRTRHLAGRFAAKEAFLKAWSSTNRGNPPTLSPEDLDLREVEVVHDAHGRPAIRLHGPVREAVATLVVHLSISHDGGTAAAVVILEAPASSEAPGTLRASDQA